MGGPLGRGKEEPGPAVQRMQAFVWPAPALQFRQTEEEPLIDRGSWTIVRRDPSVLNLVAAQALLVGPFLVASRRGDDVAGRGVAGNAVVLVLDRNIPQTQGGIPCANLKIFPALLTPSHVV